ncbi:MAG: carboxypeptidase regulatory-like domain-containing protein [Saprospiraceae bacterium]|nr:carboxypeptidase regulatory-like domain-containing protein [Saprospiraceae bacterium]MBL0024149.1 carboxypeptidase regulatory-like domain-containing protein [Saprospiraceae bacterium]
MFFKRKYTTWIVCIFALVSCHKDLETSSSEVTSVFTPLVVKEITGSIIGYVYDENNQPVSDASVTIYSGSAITNKFGVFTFENTRMDQQGTYIRISKSGYFHASDYVYPADKSTTYSYVKILALDKSTPIDSKSGGTVNISGGGKIIFPSDAFADSQGNSFNGTIGVFAKYLNPNDREISNVMPGGLIGDGTDENTMVLGTMGMIGVELRDNGGNKLYIKNGKKVGIQFPAILTSGANEIPLWSFDEIKGRWKEEGKAILSGGNYIAEVSHFSFWNVDAKFPIVDICGKVVYENGEPAINITVKVETDGMGSSFGVTNSQGEFCGKMPKGKKLKIKVYHTACKTDITEVTVGPFENKTILDNIIVKSVSPFKIKGKLTCNSTPVSNGILVVKIKDATLVYKSEPDGSFGADLTHFLCGDIIPINIFGYNNISSETSQSVVVTSANAQNLILDVCATTCDLKADITYDCDKVITANIAGGSGNYSYKWDFNNTTTKTVTLSTQDSTLDARTYCVTVTDIATKCEKVFCKQVGGKLVAGIESSCEKGILYAYFRGGTLPVTYKWSDGSSVKEFKPAALGKYCVTITDAAGCTDFACADLSSPLLIADSPSGCSKNIYNISSSPFTSGQITSIGTVNSNQLTFPISIDIFKTGFNLGILIRDNQCSASKQIKLPQLVQGLVTTVVNTSCGTCNDGKINITVSMAAQCSDCKVGDIKIFKIEDLSNDLLAVNTAGTLPKGEYYVVVTDANNGCYIAFNRVKIL